LDGNHVAKTKRRALQQKRHAAHRACSNAQALIDLLTKTSFLLWTWNTMQIAIVSTAISLVLGTMLAYPLARMRFAGASLIAMTVAAVYLVPQPLLFIPLADVTTG
jgi:ABC-type glycerol-3-phosphate transport system permease component